MLRAVGAVVPAAYLEQMKASLMVLAQKDKPDLVPEIEALFSA